MIATRHGVTLAGREQLDPPSRHFTVDCFSNLGGFIVRGIHKTPALERWLSTSVTRHLSNETR